MAHVMVRRQPPVWHAPHARSLSPRQWIVATLVLSLGFLAGLLVTMGMTMTSRTWSTNAMTATTLAHDKLELLQAAGVSQKNVDRQVETEEYHSLPAFPQFKRHTTLLPNTPAPHLTTVTVHVLWDSDTHSVQLRTILAE